MIFLIGIGIFGFIIYILWYTGKAVALFDFEDDHDEVGGDNSVS